MVVSTYSKKVWGLITGPSKGPLCVEFACSCGFSYRKTCLGQTPPSDHPAISYRLAMLGSQGAGGFTADLRQDTALIVRQSFAEPLIQADNQSQSLLRAPSKPINLTAC